MKSLRLLIKTSILCFVCLLMSGLAHATTTVDLYESCHMMVRDHDPQVPHTHSEADDLDTGVCIGYIEGLLTGMIDLYVHFDGQMYQLILLNDNLTAHDVAKTFVEYAQKHPDIFKDSPRWAVIRCLTDSKALGMRKALR